jgi:DNA-binding protein HU-beta
MNKAELAEKYSEELECSRAEAGRAVDTVFGIIERALSKGKEVKIFGLGTFKVAWKKARSGRHPGTGEEIKIPRRKRLAFKASKSFTEQLNS